MPRKTTKKRTEGTVAASQQGRPSLLFDDLRTDVVSLSKLDEYVCSNTTGCKLEFVFADVTGLGMDAEATIRDTLKSVVETEEHQVGFCPRTKREPEALPFLSLESTLRNQDNRRNIFYFGAVKYAALESAEHRAKISLSKIVSHLNLRRSNSGARCIFTYNSIDKNEICKIFDFIYNNLYRINFGGDTLITHISLVKYIDITNNVRRACEDDFKKVADSFAEIVANATFDTLSNLMDENERTRFADLQYQQIENIKPSLVNGIVYGGNRENDRPWGFEKVVEESRQKLLAAYIRHTEEPYDPQGEMPVEDYIEKHLKPKLSKFCLPNKVLGQASPSAFSAKYNRK